ncbi:hypothetical protein [Phytoactinopolyspora limicola]|uniref:hypothetical protein n=1 Tax=Phytoactinopolyspora limicola TaxID=2715536 RepID=UPI001407834A|nr:hypothetical protein [Phytoactinopolyspora limicola]
MNEVGWWRRNRWGLIGLPVVLLAALAASSYHVEDWWWLARPRVAVPATEGEWVHFTDIRYDRSGDVPIELSARLAGLEEAVEPFGGVDDELNLPTGTKGVAVVLEFQVAADMPLTACRLSVVGADGTEYAYQYAPPSIRQAPSPCVPPDRRGPELDLFEGLEFADGDPRPEEWAVRPVVVIPDDVEIVEVRLTWGPPRHLVFQVR